MIASGKRRSASITRSSDRPITRCRGGAAAGYTLVAVVIGMAILVIMTAAVAPAVSIIMQRDREDELLFRGRQYARAIVLFQRRYGRLPNSLKEMYENHPRTLRRLFKEPMCNCDDWFLIIQNSPEAMIGGAVPGVPPPSGLAPTPVPRSFGGSKPPPNVGPIVGVRSQVKKNALREWRGQKTYDQWRFIAGDADRDLIPVLPGVPGGPGNRAPGPAPPGQPPSPPGARPGA